MIKFYAPLWFLLNGVLLSALVFFQVASWEDDRLQHEIEFRVDTRIIAIKARLDQTFETLNHIGAAIHHRFVIDGQDEARSAGIAALTGAPDSVKSDMRLLVWLPRLISADPKHNTLAEYRDFGHQILMAHQGATNWLMTKGHPIPNRWKHMLMAMDTGQPQVDIHLEDDGHHALTIFMPVYESGVSDDLNSSRKTLIGFVVGEWDVALLISGVIQALPVDAFDYYLTDVSEPQGAPFYFHLSRSRTAENQDVHTNLGSEKIIRVGEYQWRIRFEAAPAFLRLHQTFVAWQSLAFGLLLTFLLSGYIWSKSRKTMIIEALVERRSMELHFEQIKFAAVIDHVTEGIITFDERGLIESFNPAARRLFGYSNEEIIGQNVKMLIHEPFRGVHDDYLDYFIKTGEKKVTGIDRELTGQRKDGSTFPLELSVSKAVIGGIRHFVCVTRDITERMQIQEKIRQLQMREKSEFMGN